MSRVASRGDRATGVFGTAWGVTVFMIFLLFAVQLLFGLYARTTVTAVATDIAQDMALEGPTSLDEPRVDEYRTDAEDRLGRYARNTSFTFSMLDADRDGKGDTVAVRVEADLPTLLPTRWIPSTPTSFTRTMHARVEIVQGAP